MASTTKNGYQRSSPNSVRQIWRMYFDEKVVNAWSSPASRLHQYCPLFTALPCMSGLNISFILSEAFANYSNEVRCLLTLFPAASTLSLHTFLGGMGVRILYSALSYEAVNFTKAGSIVFRRQQVLNTNVFINQLTKEFQG